MTPEQRAALLVLRQQISDQIDGDSPSDSRYSRWCELCDLALGEVVDPWALMMHASAIKAMKEQMGEGMNIINEWIAQHPEIAAANKQSQDDLYCELSYADRDRGYPLTQRMLRRLGLHPDCRRGSYAHIPTPKENEIITEYARLECSITDALCAIAIRTRGGSYGMGSEIEAMVNNALRECEG